MDTVQKAIVMEFQWLQEPKRIKTCQLGRDRGEEDGYYLVSMAPRA